jgi:hypothetical protein
MSYLLGLLPATALTIAGYVFLFFLPALNGALRTFGKYLWHWAFTLFALIILGNIRRGSRRPSLPLLRDARSARADAQFPS